MSDTLALRPPGFGAPAMLRFWSGHAKRPAAAAAPSPQQSRRTLRALVEQTKASPGVALFDAVEAGVPTHMVELIANATGEPITRVMEMVGVSPTTFRRKDEAGEPLPDAAGHRVMAFLRVLATLSRLLDESGDAQAVATFDLEGWAAKWMREPLPELAGKTPAELLRNPEGQRAVEQVLERMRGGLPA